MREKLNKKEKMDNWETNLVLFKKQREILSVKYKKTQKFKKGVKNINKLIRQYLPKK